MKRLTKNNLQLILERLNECCFDCIDNGNRNKAKQDLELINLVQERMGGETFEDLESFLLDDSDHINYHHKRKLLEEEEAVITKLVAFAKSDKTEPSDDLRLAFEKDSYYFTLTAEDARMYQELRRKCFNRLLIICIKSCTSDEMKKLESISTTLTKDYYPMGNEENH